MLHSKQKVTEAIRNLNYDFTQFNLNDFVSHIEARRRRPIVIDHPPLDPELFGIWIPADGVNYIFVNGTAHPVHQVHSLLHEIAHIVLQHPCYPLDQVLSPVLLERLQMQMANGCARFAPSNQMTQTPEEREAEEFVFQIQEQVIRAKRLQELTAVGSSIKTLRPLVNTSES